MPKIVSTLTDVANVYCFHKNIKLKHCKYAINYPAISSTAPYVTQYKLSIQSGTFLEVIHSILQAWAKW